MLLPATLFSGDDLSHRTPVATLPAEVSTPVCEGSLVADRGVLYFSHPQSETRIRIRCELQDAHGKALPGFTRNESVVRACEDPWCGECKLEICVWESG